MDDPWQQSTGFTLAPSALRRISQRKGDQARFGDAQTARGELVARSNMRRGAKSKLLEHPASAFNALANRLHGGAGSPMVTMPTMVAELGRYPTAAG
jgi:hypothetical protein